MRWASALFAVCAFGLGQAAIDLNGQQVVEPATSDEDPSPIANINTYHPDQHDCPLLCTDYANTHSWIPYYTVQRLHRCAEPMLLQLAVGRPVDDPKTDILIRSCTLGGRRVSAAGVRIGSSSTEELEPVDNPKKSDDLVLASLDVAPACAVNGTKVKDLPELIASLLEGLGTFFRTPDNCDENILFAYHNRTVAGVYIGASLGKPTVVSAIDALEKSFGSRSSAPARTVVELCGGGRKPERVLGIAIESGQDLASVQRSVLAWSKGLCVVGGGSGLRTSGVLAGAKVFDITGAPFATNTTTTTTTTNSTARVASWNVPHLLNSFASRLLLPTGAPALSADGKTIIKRATCRYIQVVAGDGCASLVSRCGISNADFTKYNPKSNLCSSLKVNDYVCCSAGDPYTEPKPDPPKQGQDGVCATHLIKDGDSCSALAKQFGVTVDDIEKWNKGKTWAWTKCEDMLLGYNMCFSDGLAPMPPPQKGTECGPLVPDTERPANGVSIADLNPCPLKACCSNWGFCGVFPAHCDIHAPEGGGPGTKLKGFSNTCVSNCGNEIKKVSGPPAVFGRVGYYSAFNENRKCLWRKAKNANTDGTYTHIHWAFGDIDPNGWKPAIKDGKGQWADFKALTGVKKIFSLGGWAFSTEPATYNIIRQAIL